MVKLTGMPKLIRMKKAYKGYASLLVLCWGIRRTETDPFFSMCRHKIILVVSTGCPVLAEKALQGVLESSITTALLDHTLSDAKLNAFLGKNEWIHSSAIYWWWYGVENVFKTRANLYMCGA